MGPLRLVAVFALACTAGCFGNGYDNSQPDGRGLSLAWSLVDNAAPDPTTAPSLSCKDAGITVIRVDALDKDGGARYRTDFACATNEGVTPPVPLSTYTISVDALAGTKLASTTQFDADNFDDADADLGLVIFRVQR